MIEEKYISRSESFVFREIEGEIILLSDDGLQIHQLNKTASMIWKLADGKTKVKNIVSLMYKRFDVEKDVLKQDVREFVQNLVKKGILTIDGRSK